MNPKKKNPRDANDEVEELLRAAEDAALLKINLNSHTVHASPSDLEPDLEQRFRDLKSGSKLKAKKENKSDKVNEEVDEDDLLARFATLKASLPKPNPSILSPFVGIGTSDTSFGDDGGDGSLGGKVNIDDEDDDEVEKVIRWAMDAARLDPSTSSDDEDNNKDDDFDDDDTSDDDSQKKPKGKQN